jgi:type II secretory pathway pseudopilin PulG
LFENKNHKKKGGNKMKKWQKYLLIGLGSLIFVFMLFATIDNIAGLGLLPGLGKIIVNYWIFILVVIGILGGLAAVGGFIIWLVLSEQAEKKEQQKLIRKMQREIHELKTGKEAESEQAEVVPAKTKSAKKPEKDPGEFQVKEDEEETKEVPPPAPPAPTPAQETDEAGLKGLFNEIKDVKKGNRRIFWIGLSTLIILLLLTCGLGFGAYKFWQRSNYFKAKTETLEGVMKSCIETNAFYQILQKQQQLMIMFGIPLPESINPEEVKKWNVEAMFTNLYCQFRGKQADVNKSYLTLLPKYPQAQKCACDIQACTVGDQAPILATPVLGSTVEKSEPKSKPDEKAKEPEKIKPAKPRSFCGDGHCNGDEDHATCPNDCPDESPPVEPLPTPKAPKVEEKNETPPESINASPGCENGE